MRKINLKIIQLNPKKAKVIKTNRVYFGIQIIQIKAKNIKKYKRIQKNKKTGKKKKIKKLINSKTRAKNLL